MFIRRAEISDAEALYGLNCLFNQIDTPVDCIRDSLQNSREIAFVIGNEHELIGFISCVVLESFCYIEKFAEILEFFILKRYRRKGYGTMLFKHCEDYLISNGISNYQLFTAKANRIAQRFYENQKYFKSNEYMYRKRLRENGK